MRSSRERDYEQEALDALSNEDLDLLQEASALYRYGYSETQVKETMGEGWPLAEIAIERYMRISINPINPASGYMRQDFILSSHVMLSRFVLPFGS